MASLGILTLLILDNPNPSIPCRLRTARLLRCFVPTCGRQGAAGQGLRGFQGAARGGLSGGRALRLAQQSARRGARWNCRGGAGRPGRGGPRGPARRVALVAHGGYGRRDVAPYSDVDLMILHRRGAAGRVARLAERLLRDVFDAGLVLGHSVRTLRQACRLACRDAHDLHLAGRVAAAGRQRRRSSTASCAASGGRSAGARPADARPSQQSRQRRAAPLRRDRVPAGAEHQALAAARSATCSCSAGSASPATASASRGELARARACWRARTSTAIQPGQRVPAPAPQRAALPRRPGQRRAQPRRAAPHGRAAAATRPAAGLLPVEQFMQDYFRHTSQVSHVVRGSWPRPPRASGCGEVADRALRPPRSRTTARRARRA